MIPVDRLQRAGATPEEIAGLPGQDDPVERFADRADQDIREWLAEIGSRAESEFSQVRELTKVELLEQADAAGIDVPAGATKADILELLEQAEETVSEAS